jgi:hypothetical protein
MVNHPRLCSLLFDAKRNHDSLLEKSKITCPDMFLASIVFQDSMKFVQQVVLEDLSKVKGIPSECSEVMVWHVDNTAVPSSSSSQPSMHNKRR